MRERGEIVDEVFRTLDLPIFRKIENVGEVNPNTDNSYSHNESIMLHINKFYLL